RRAVASLSCASRCRSSMCGLGNAGEEFGGEITGHRVCENLSRDFVPESTGEFLFSRGIGQSYLVDIKPGEGRAPMHDLQNPIQRGVVGWIGSCLRPERRQCSRFRGTLAMYP